MESYEVEVKVLLGQESKAKALRERMKKIDPRSKLVSTNKQLNHYFIDGNLQLLSKSLKNHLSTKGNKELTYLSKNSDNFSLRTRKKDKDVLLVVKASMGKDSSSNGVARREFEEKVDLTLNKLDSILLKCGFDYQAKWSREREEYKFKDAIVTLDRNAGYGWLAEFEKVVDSKSRITEAESKIKLLMKECGVKELPQARLERMFTYYNKNWRRYYGTKKVFTVK